MLSFLSRRDFIKTTAIGSVGLVGTFNINDSSAFALHNKKSDLYTLSMELLKLWSESLLKLQVTDKSKPEQYGGILCPSKKIIHGRVGDTIYPFLHMASKTGQSKYLDSAMLLYRWMERSVSQEDGSWLNEPKKGSWKGTTVFSAIALAEALKHHRVIMDSSFKKEVEERLKKAGEFIYATFSMDYGNINYPITASYGLSLLGMLLDIPKFKEKGREFAHQSLQFITKKDGFIYGEGGPYYEASKKGCLSVDLGYNVEESLPALVLYGLLTKDNEVLEKVTRSLQTHMEFMLPDGAWDNSWGTRNYKWTYWGSRTSDGCQPAYALLANRDPRFYKVALKNTQLLQQCTHSGLLYGGPHYTSHNILPSVHHTFCHMKALATILDHKDSRKAVDVEKVILPREEVYGSRFFSDIQTWLISKGKYRATVTGYDREYKKTKNGHATGGAVTMLWHKKAGPLFAASMNAYQLYESDNMQVNDDPYTMPLTPRVELKVNGKTYMNISDLLAEVEVENNNDKLTIATRSKLVDENQESPSSGEINCLISYCFMEDKVILKFNHDDTLYGKQIKVIVPIISNSTEKITFKSNSLQIDKEASIVKIVSNHSLIKMPTAKDRVFNFVPGFEAIPLAIEENNAVIEIEVV